MFSSPCKGFVLTHELCHTPRPSGVSDEESEKLHGEDTEMGEPLIESSHKEVVTIWVFLLWTIARRGRIMSLPGVFGAVIDGLLDRVGIGGGLLRDGHISMLPSRIVISLPGVAGVLSEVYSVHPLLSSLPGVLGISLYIGYEATGTSEGARTKSLLRGERERTSLASSESSLSSSATIPLPGVCGLSTSSTAGDVGLLFIKRSGSLSTKQPVGVRGLRFSMFCGDSLVHSGLSITTSSSGATVTQIINYY